MRPWKVRREQELASVQSQDPIIPDVSGSQVCDHPAWLLQVGFLRGYPRKVLRLLCLSTCLLDLTQEVFQNPSFPSHSEKPGFFLYRHTCLLPNDVQKADLPPKEDCQAHQRLFSVKPRQGDKHSHRKSSIFSLRITSPRRTPLRETITFIWMCKLCYVCWTKNKIK